MDVGMIAGLLLGGMVLGGAAVWLFLNVRHNARIEAAVSQVQMPLQAELAKLTERASQIPRLDSDLKELERELDIARTANGALRQEKATLQANAERLPGLTEELKEATSRAAATNTTLAEYRESNAQLATDLKGTQANLKAAQDDLAAERNARAAADTTLAEYRESNAQLATGLKGTQANLKAAQDDLAAERDALTAADLEVRRLSGELTASNERLEAEKKGAEEKLALLLEAKESLSNQFKSLASDILEEKSLRFTEQNRTNIDQLLSPLRDKLTGFENQVTQVYGDAGKERVKLAEQVRQLLELNQVLSEDAKNLTSALKGSVKSQGTWGEYILERVLEVSGLRKGEEYVAQERHTTEDGKRLQPDIVINLPENRSLVVDAKVSLVAYERYSSAETEEERAVALRQHLESVRGHVKALAEKNYQALYRLQTLDFVMLFVPVEPAFMLAVANDRELAMEAWRRNVILVSPSTLLFAVRTIAHLWRQEAQNRNAQDIARRGAELYDKLVGFVLDLKRVGAALKSAHDAYDDADRKLVSGRGNVIRQAEMLRDLGVKPTKQLPRHLVEQASPDVLLPSISTLVDDSPSATPDSRSAEAEVATAGT